jgi:hypothetical protein
MFSSSWTIDVSKTVADEWLRDGQHEHASVASFARFSLDLLRFGAPPHLLLASQVAGADEVRHAQVSFGLAARFGQNVDGVQVGSFPIERVDLTPTLTAMTNRTFEEGCNGESAAVVRIAYTLRFVHEASPVRAVLQQLLAEEARHAALAWSTVRWALGQGAELSPPLPAQPSQLARKTQGNHVFSSALTWGGRLAPDVMSEIDELVADVWIKLWQQALIQSPTAALPDVPVPAGILGEALAEAMTLVRGEMASAELGI